MDKDWVDDKIVYDLIKGLIEVIKDFRKIPNVKIVIALRTNILNKVFKKNLSRGIQREKYEHLYLKIEWDSNDLRNLINNRLSVLMRGQYSQKPPTIDEILPKSTKKFQSGFDYILERTLLRPRDLISYFNILMKNSNGNTSIPRDVIKKSEREYSIGRLHALDDEWLENFGSLEVLYSFLKSGHHSFTIDDISEKTKDIFFDNVVNNEIEKLNNNLQDSFNNFVKNLELSPLIQQVLIILYEVGIIGIKVSPIDSIDFVIKSVSYSEEDLEMTSRFYVHKMVHKALRIKSTKPKHNMT